MEENNITQYKLQKMGVPQSTVSNILNEGKSPTEKTIRKICNALKIDMPKFINNKNQEETDNTLPFVIDRIKEMAKTEEEKQAYAYLISQTDEELEHRLESAMKKAKSLPAEYKKALTLVINSFYEVHK